MCAIISVTLHITLFCCCHHLQCHSYCDSYYDAFALSMQTVLCLKFNYLPKWTITSLVVDEFLPHRNWFFWQILICGTIITHT